MGMTAAVARKWRLSINRCEQSGVRSHCPYNVFVGTLTPEQRRD
jgi:hypothetical protein